MENNKKNVVIFYHDDTDGIASAMVIYRMLEVLPVPNTNTVMLPCRHEKPNMHIDTSRVSGEIEQMFVVDYSPSTEEEIRVLEEMGRTDSMVFIDHHDTSRILLKNDIIGTDISLFTRTSEEVSAAVLCYAFAICMITDQESITKYDQTLEDIISEKIKLPDWIAFVSDNDTFKNEYAESKYLSLALNNMSDREELDFFLDISVDLFKKTPPSLMEVSTDDILYDMIDRGEIMYEYQEKLNEAVMKMSSFDCELHLQISREFIDPDNTLGLPEQIDQSGKFCCVNGYGNSRVFGKAYDDHDGVIIFSYNGETYEYNAYSKEEGFQVNLLALYFRKIDKLNGGGHYHAAGWSSPTNRFAKGGKYTLTEDGIL